MGACCGKPKAPGAVKKPRIECSLIIVGLDNAGKTTIANNLRGEPLGFVAPTYGMEKDDFSKDHFDVNLFGLGGGKRIRGYWNNYFDDAHGIIYVVDSADIERLDEVAKSVAELVGDPKIQGKPILIYANKQDLPQALSEVEIAKRLGLEQLQQCPHHIVRCVALVKREGSKKEDPGRSDPDPVIPEGMNWMLKTLDSNWPALKARVDKDLEARAIANKKEAERKRAEVEKFKQEEEEERKRQEIAQQKQALQPPQSQPQPQQQPQQAPSAQSSPPTHQTAPSTVLSVSNIDTTAASSSADAQSSSSAPTAGHSKQASQQHITVNGMAAHNEDTNGTVASSASSSSAASTANGHANSTDDKPTQYKPETLVFTDASNTTNNSNKPSTPRHHAAALPGMIAEHPSTPNRHQHDDARDASATPDNRT